MQELDLNQQVTAAAAPSDVVVEVDDFSNLKKKPKTKTVKFEEDESGVDVNILKSVII